MLLGSDRRPKNNVEGAAPGARSDTIILIRLDPSKNATAMMSLPRDLKVEIPGHGTDKINAAYELGGPKLTLKTVKRLTGLRINHVINVDFEGFYQAVNAIGCVYADIDRRYYNNIARATPSSTSSRATSACAAARRSSTSASATRTTTSSAPPASRTSCARPSSRSASAG